MEDPAVSSCPIPAIPLEESEHIVRPHRSAEIAKHVAVVVRFAIGGIDLQFIWPADTLHRGRQGAPPAESMPAQ
jgi:hypothetical protein